MTQPEEFYCTGCGSTDITREAICYWDNVTQSYADFEVVPEGYDWCGACSSHGRCDFRPITDVKTLAQIAIQKSERKTA